MTGVLGGSDFVLHRKYEKFFTVFDQLPSLISISFFCLWILYNNPEQVLEGYIIRGFNHYLFLNPFSQILNEVSDIFNCFFFDFHGKASLNSA